MTNRINRRLPSQEGFTMALVMGVLLLATTLGLAAFAAARGDIHVSGVSKNRKQAYAAAEAGLGWFQSRLAADNAYWSKCTSVPPVSSGQAAPVSQQWNGAGNDPRIWRAVPGSTAQYTIELLPAPGKAACDSTLGDANMIDPANGNFRIRATGRFQGQKRSIVGRFRRARFLDFLWFTDFETTDPLAYPDYTFPGTNPPYKYVDYANDYCANRYRTARDAAPYRYCQEIQFAGNDDLNGPLHSNDSLLICGSATFGRSSSDKVESSQNEDIAATGSSSPGWRPNCNGTTPDFKAPFKFAQPTLQMPATNATLTANAQAAYTFTGLTLIELKSNGTMDVTNAARGWTTPRNVAWPSNGLVYVVSGSCGSSQPPVSQTYGEPAGCANAVVKGTYTKDLTIASAKDVVINGNLQRSGDVLVGLIADNFVRIYHPTAVSATDPTCDQNKDGPYGPDFSTVTVEAAILSLQHSFTVDNYDCGAPLGLLTVKGALAQKYRGAVAQGGASGTIHGFVKDYNYDDRFRYRNPPFFLDPVNAAWRLLRTNEQVPAR